jgi:branched-chain amino acid transport system substrate-binding protein
VVRLPSRVAAFLVLLATIAAAPAARADIAIGLVAPLTGNLAILGQQMRTGATQAVADINRDGGVNGEKLTLEVMDDGCDAKTADALANQLAGKGAVMVVGHLCLSASLAAATVYAANQIVQISPGTTYPKLTDERAGPGVFRLAERDDQQGVVAGKFLAARYAGKNVAILNDDSTYGKDLADQVRAAMNAAGKRETLTQAYTAGGDFADLVSRLKASAIDAVFVGGLHTDIARLARMMRDQGMATRIVAGDALATEEFWTAAGAAGQGALMTLPADARANPEAAAVVKAFRAAGTEPEGLVLNAYAAVQIWAAAAAGARAVRFEDVAAALDKGTFASVLGPVTFDDKGDADATRFVLYEWRDGRYAPLDAAPAKPAR